LGDVNPIGAYHVTTKSPAETQAAYRQRLKDRQSKAEAAARAETERLQSRIRELEAENVELRAIKEMMS
jgi:hypothetical protein